MRAPLSIIVPTLNATAALGPLLGGLAEGLQAGLIREVILSDGGSADGIADVAQASGAALVIGPPGRGGQMARGAAAAQGRWMLFLHADSRLPQGWSAAVLRHIADADRAGYFDLAFDAAGLAPRLVAGWANLRSRAFGLPYGDQGLLISRALYGAVGGFADQPLMEDVAMARALRGRLAPLGLPLTTGADRYLAGGWVRRGARNWWLLARYFSGADPTALARSYSAPPSSRN